MFGLDDRGKVLVTPVSSRVRGVSPASPISVSLINEYSKETAGLLHGQQLWQIGVKHCGFLNKTRARTLGVPSIRKVRQAASRIRGKQKQMRHQIDSPRDKSTGGGW